MHWRLFFCLFFSSYIVNAQAPFITTWKTDNPGVSSSTSITIPGENGTFDVDWDNDGVYDDLGVSGNVTHDFGIAGTYTIRITGNLKWIRFEHSGDAEKIIDIVQWGDLQ